MQDSNSNKNTAHPLECDTACSPSMIWMLNAKWHMHEHGTWDTNCKWDYNATTTAKNNDTWIVMQAACVVHDCCVCDCSGITCLYKHLHRDYLWWWRCYLNAIKYWGMWNCKLTILFDRKHIIKLKNFLSAKEILHPQSSTSLRACVCVYHLSSPTRRNLIWSPARTRLIFL